MHLGSRLSKEAANFAGEGDPVLVLERANRVDENLKDCSRSDKLLIRIAIGTCKLCR